MKGAVKILPVAFSLADYEFIRKKYSTVRDSMINHCDRQFT